MLHVIIGTDVDTRIKKRASLVTEKNGEIIVLDDTTSSLVTLEQYIYPSLFSISMPVVHARYLLEEYGEELSKQLLQKMVNSPTIFILEEKGLRAPIIKDIEKEGGLIHHDKPNKQSLKQNTIFAVTNALTATSKKDRWLAYEQARVEHSPEAIIGILYWKLRDLIEKSGSRAQHFSDIYRALMQAHKQSWQKGVPLHLAIEKVILTA
jgi:hypothetical protein